MTHPAPAAPLRLAVTALALLAVLGLVVALSPATEGWRWRPLHPVVLGLVVATLLALPRDRGALAVLVASVTARALTASPRVLMHFAKPYGFLLDARGDVSPDRTYGDGWDATYGLLVRLGGGGDDVTHRVSTALSALLPVALYDLVLRATGRPVAAWTAGLAAALTPLAVALAPTPEHFVLVSTLQVLAVAGSLRRDPLGDALAVCAGGLLAHTRPLQLVVVAVPLLLLVGGRRRRGALVLAGLAAWRGVELGTHLAAGAVGTALPTPARVLGGAWQIGPDAPWLALDPTRVPAGLALLALPGAALAVRHRARGAWALPALLVLGSLLYLEHRYVPDRLRFQLPTLAWLAALAGLTVDALAARHRAAGAAALVLLVGSAWPARAPLDPPFTWQVEHALLRRAVAEAPAGAVVRMAIPHDPNGTMRRWASLGSAASWVADDGKPHPGEYRWVGTADLHPHARPVPWEHLQPVWETTAPGVWGGVPDLFLDAPYPPQPVRMGLYRVVEVAGSELGAVDERPPG